MDDKYFDDAREMFLTQGWKDFQAEVQSSIESLRIESLEDEKAFWMAKGQLAVLHRVAAYENVVLAAQEQEDA